MSYAATPLSIEKDGLLEARFCFRMPRLPVGSYAIGIALAEGSQKQHTTHHWLHEALTFQSHASSIGQVLMGLPMQNIVLTPRGSADVDF